MAAESSKKSQQDGPRYPGAVLFSLLNGQALAARFKPIKKLDESASARSELQRCKNRFEALLQAAAAAKARSLGRKTLEGKDIQDAFEFLMAEEELTPWGRARLYSRLVIQRALQWVGLVTVSFNLRVMQPHWDRVFGRTDPLPFTDESQQAALYAMSGFVLLVIGWAIEAVFHRK